MKYQSSWHLFHGFCFSLIALRYIASSLHPQRNHLNLVIAQNDLGFQRVHVVSCNQGNYAHCRGSKTKKSIWYSHAGLPLMLITPPVCTTKHHVRAVVWWNYMWDGGVAIWAKESGDWGSLCCFNSTCPSFITKHTGGGGMVVTSRVSWPGFFCWLVPSVPHSENFIYWWCILFQPDYGLHICTQIPCLSPNLLFVHFVCIFCHPKLIFQFVTFSLFPSALPLPVSLPDSSGHCSDSHVYHVSSHRH